MPHTYGCDGGSARASTSADGGPLRYRVVHSAKLWTAGDAPKLERKIIEGDVDLMT